MDYSRNIRIHVVVHVYYSFCGRNGNIQSCDTGYKHVAYPTPNLKYDNRIQEKGYTIVYIAFRYSCIYAGRHAYQLYMELELYN